MLDVGNIFIHGVVQFLDFYRGQLTIYYVVESHIYEKQIVYHHLLEKKKDLQFNFKFHSLPVNYKTLFVCFYNFFYRSTTKRYLKLILFCKYSADTW